MNFVVALRYNILLPNWSCMQNFIKLQLAFPINHHSLIRQ